MVCLALFISLLISFPVMLMVHLRDAIVVVACIMLGVLFPIMLIGGILNGRAKKEPRNNT